MSTMTLTRLPRTLNTHSAASRCFATHARTRARAGPVHSAATAAATTSSPALGQCRILIRNKHHLTTCTNSTPYPSSSSSASTAAHRPYGHLAAVESSPLPPPLMPLSTLPPPPMPQQLHRPTHVRAFPKSTLDLPAAGPRRRYSPQHFYQNRILDPYVHQSVHAITLRQLVFFGRHMQEDKLLKSANYVRTELPVRLAHRIRDFQNLPFIVGTNPHIELVYDLYWQAFEKLSKVREIRTLDENEAFCEMVKTLLNDHLVVIPQLALGIMECSPHIPAPQIDQFMNKMLRSRISRRVLAEQHISLTANYNSPNHMLTDRGYIGIIYTHCRPKEIVERTATMAAETVRQAMGVEPPKVVLDGSVNAEFSYIPDHIEYILYELIKNSMRFVIQKHHNERELPPIQITVCEGTEDIVFRVSDRGGGIRPEVESNLWSYAQSAARFANFEKVSRMAATVQEQMVSPTRSVNAAPGYHEAASNDTVSGVLRPDRNAELFSGDKDGVVLPPPPAGTMADMGAARAKSSPSTSARQPGDKIQDDAMHLGIGLPMSRVYAEYWGGDLKVHTMQGYGTDAYARFCKFGNIYENFDV